MRTDATILLYVLHAFQKKSKRRVATPRTDRELIRSRLKAAELHYVQWRGQHGEEER